MDDFLTDRHINQDFDWDKLFNEGNSNSQTSLENTEESDSSSSLSFKGFDSPDHSKRKKLSDFITNQMSSKDSDLPEQDIIEGIKFLSFISEKDLMEYSKLQHEQGTTSDDGLEILDDGSFSDRSSNHVIVPTKTKDITRIKGWKNKHFAGINSSGDSRNSIRYEDDGFGDDFDIKSVVYGSSEEQDSLDYSAAVLTKCNQDESWNKNNPNEPSEESSYSSCNGNSTTFNTPIINESNAIDSEERRFNFQKTILAPISSEKNTIVHNSEIKSLDLIINVHEKHNQVSASNNDFYFEKMNQSSSKNDLKSFLTPLSALKLSQDKTDRTLKEIPGVYKSRVKLGFIDKLTEKISSNSDKEEDEVLDKASENLTTENSIFWRVSKEKLLAGNIFDVEVTPGKEDVIVISNSNSLIKSDFTKKAIKTTLSIAKSTQNKLEYLQKKDKHIDGENLSNGAFQSSTLDNISTNFGHLHIDFTIPKLDAIDNVTLEVELPKNNVTKTFQQRKEIKRSNIIKAKTVAERKQRIADFKRASKRKQADKIKKNNMSLRSYNLKKEKKSDSCNVSNKNNGRMQQKRLWVHDEWFDDHGVIVYGQEKPLRSILTEWPLSCLKYSQPNVNDNKIKQNNLGMVINIGFRRPLYKEIADKINYLSSGNTPITKEFAKFAVSAFQPSTKGPFTVTRILVPVKDDRLNELMRPINHDYCHSDSSLLKQYLESSTTINKRKSCSTDDSNNLKRQREYDNSNVSDEIWYCVNKIVGYAVKKELFEEIIDNYDPDDDRCSGIKEQENNKLNNSILKTYHKLKQKKTKLQRQIEQLGGTFISVQGDIAEDNLSQVTENEICSKEYCQKGCVCQQKIDKYNHCGKAQCMFTCNCSPVSKKQGCEVKSKVWLLPEVLRLKNTSQANLAREEREYHQTVIMSNDKTITIETKHKKRERKIPSKFKDEILLDYRKDDDDNDDILCNYGVENKGKDFPEYLCSNSPKILALDSYLQRTHKDKHINQGLTNCYVQIDKSLEKNKKVKSRNVAVKRTGFTSSQLFDTDNDCSRTYGTSIDIVNRNFFCKIPTKNVDLYSANSRCSSLKDLTSSPSSEIRIFKEDLECEISQGDENEGLCLENISPSDESGLAIDFICSLPPEQFEKQGSLENEETTIIDNEPTRCINLNSASKREIINENVNRGKNEKFVYASLPITETECKWWVVEIDVEKFSHLVCSSDKRSLTYNNLCRTVFSAEFGKKTVCIPLEKKYSIFKEKFGAYAVPGHTHLIFFGPYNVSESHGITALKLSSDRYSQVPFTTKFSHSERFKSLGVPMSKNEVENSTPLSVSALWWYSTGKTNSHSKESNRVSTMDEIKMSSNAILRPPVNETRDNMILSSKNEQKTCQYSNEKANKGIKFNLPENSETTLRASKDVESFDNVIAHQISSNTVCEPNESLCDTSTLQNQPCQTNARRKVKTSKKIFVKKMGKSKSNNKFSNISSKLNNKRSLLKKNNKVIITNRKTSKNITNLNPKLKTMEPSLRNFKTTDSRSRNDSILESFEGNSGNVLDDLDDSNELWDDIVVDEESYPPSPTKRDTNRIKHEIYDKPSKPIKDERPKQIPRSLLLKNPVKGIVPDTAFMCLTPGVGYVAVKEFTLDKIVICDPFDEIWEHQFYDRNHASDWLNETFKKRFTFVEDFEMEWLLIKGSLVKIAPPLNKDVFKTGGKNIEISRTGVKLSVHPRRQVRNDLEKARRLQISHLCMVLRHEVLPQLKSKPSNYAVITNAVYMTQVQKIIDFELQSFKESLRAIHDKKTRKLKALFKAIKNPNEKKRAILMMASNKEKFVKSRKKDFEFYMEEMKDQEFQYIEKMKSGVLRPLGKSVEEYKSTLNNNPRARPLEGKLIRKKLSTEKQTESRESGFTNEKVEEIINLVDSDEDVNNAILDEDDHNAILDEDYNNAILDEDDDDDVIIQEDNHDVIEINSEDEDDVVIVSEIGPDCMKNKDKAKGLSNSWNRKRQLSPLYQPKVKRSLSSPQLINLVTTPNIRQNVGERRVETNLINRGRVSPLLMLTDSPVDTEKQYTQNVCNGVEFVSVPEDGYEVFDTVPEKRFRDYDTVARPPSVATTNNEQFLPLSVSNRVNIINTSASTFVSSLAVQNQSSNLMVNSEPDNSVSKKKDLYLTPLGKIDLATSGYQLKVGKPVLLSKGKSGLVRLAKLPSPPKTQSSGVSLLNNLLPSISPTRAEPSSNPVSPERLNTVTLYHPSEEISETRTVQFSSMNSVSVDHDCSSLARPNILRARRNSDINCFLPNSQ